MKHPQHAIPPTMTHSTLPSSDRRRWLGESAALLAAGVLSGCGFALRQAPKFSFSAINIMGLTNTNISRAIQRNLNAAGVQVQRGGGPLPVQAVMTIEADYRERVVTGQSSGGLVTELQLRTRFRYNITAPNGRILQESSELLIERDITFSETAAIAKAAEEQMLFQDMESDITQQVLRRLAAVHI